MTVIIVCYEFLNDLTKIGSTPLLIMLLLFSSYKYYLPSMGIIGIPTKIVPFFCTFLSRISEKKDDTSTNIKIGIYLHIHQVLYPKTLWPKHYKITRNTLLNLVLFYPSKGIKFVLTKNLVR